MKEKHSKAWHLSLRGGATGNDEWLMSKRSLRESGWLKTAEWQEQGSWISRPKNMNKIGQNYEKKWEYPQVKKYEIIIPVLGT